LSTVKANDQTGGLSVKPIWKPSVWQAHVQAEDTVEEEGEDSKGDSEEITVGVGADHSEVAVEVHHNRDAETKAG
jgi:hypothetical protein